MPLNEHKDVEKLHQQEVQEAPNGVQLEAIGESDEEGDDEELEEDDADYALAPQVLKMFALNHAIYYYDT